MKINNPDINGIASTNGPFQHENFNIKDVLFHNIESLFCHGKKGGQAYLFRGKATRGKIIKEFSVRMDDKNLFYTDSYRKDLYEGVDLAMRSSH